MIKHIVLFKLKNFSSETDKLAKMNEIKEKLEALKSKIDFLRAIRVDLCCNPNEEFDICLDSTVDNMKDLAAYAGHPEHVAVLKIIREVLEKRACVDYEF